MGRTNATANPTYPPARPRLEDECLPQSRCTRLPDCGLASPKCGHGGEHDAVAESTANISNKTVAPVVQGR